MEQGEWYEVKYYADGTVKTASKIDFTANGDKFADTVEGVATLVNKFDDVLLSDAAYATKLTFIPVHRYSGDQGLPRG